MGQNYDQFFITNGDILADKELDELESTTLIMLLALTEREHPGALSVIFRQVALIYNGWRMQLTASNPETSLAAQRQLLAKALNFQNQCYNDIDDPDCNPWS